MKAIGVYSFSYRALFAVKYMAFAVIGGIIGMVIAMPLSDIMIDRFMIHIIIPKLSQRITIAIIMLILMILIMGIFILHSLRCMNKISVMDTIHGENKGERFKKIPGMFLHKKKLMNIPLFLALGDILGKIKRYAYLIFTYVVSVSMVLFVIQVVIYGQMGGFGLTGGELYEFYAIAIVLAALAIWRHRANIKRLATGTENKTDLRKIGKKS